MNRQDFTGYLLQPHTLKPEMKNDLRSLANQYSYCSSIQILYALLLQSANDHEVNFQVKKASAYAPDRKRLKEILEARVIPNNELENHQPVGNSQVIEEIRCKEVVVAEPVIHPKEEWIETVRKRLAEIEEEKRQVVLQPKPEDEPISSKNTGEPKKIGLSKEKIIEKFIQEEPRISQPKTSFFSPSEYAEKSNTDDNDIVSETLARLYMQQGNIAKARMVYGKLSLLFPEKSSYFAAQIEKADNK